MYDVGRSEPSDNYNSELAQAKTVSTQTPHTFKLLSSEDMLSDPKSGLEVINKFKLVLSTLLPNAHG